MVPQSAQVDPQAAQVDPQSAQVDPQSPVPQVQSISIILLGYCIFTVFGHALGSCNQDFGRPRLGPARQSSVHRFDGSPAHRFGGSPVHWFGGSPLHRFGGSPARRFAGASLDRFAGWPVQRFNGSAGWLSRFEPAVRTWPSRKVSESAGSNSSSPVRPPVRRFALLCIGPLWAHMGPYGSDFVCH